MFNAFVSSNRHLTGFFAGARDQYTTQPAVAHVSPAELGVPLFDPYAIEEKEAPKISAESDV